MINFCVKGAIKQIQIEDWSVYRGIVLQQPLRKHYVYVTCSM